MTLQTKKKPSCEDSANSKSVHLPSANNPYFNMILSNPACALFCCELLELFEDLLNRFCPDNPRAFNGRELDAFIAPGNLQREYGEPK
jgi:hypothetical protein